MKFSFWLVKTDGVPSKSGRPVSQRNFFQNFFFKTSKIYQCITKVKVFVSFQLVCSVKIKMIIPLLKQGKIRHHKDYGWCFIVVKMYVTWQSIFDARKVFFQILDLQLKHSSKKNIIITCILIFDISNWFFFK